VIGTRNEVAEVTASADAAKAWMVRLGAIGLFRGHAFEPNFNDRCFTDAHSVA
jgi:hypothetical protein